jgi:hypothetical protein
MSEIVPITPHFTQRRLSALFARYYTRVKAAVRAHDRQASTVAAMRASAEAKLKTDVESWQDQGRDSLIDMATALYETEQQRLLLIEQAASLYYTLLTYQLHTVEKLVKKSYEAIVFPWEVGVLCFPNGVLLEFPFAPTTEDAAVMDATDVPASEAAAAAADPFSLTNFNISTVGALATTTATSSSSSSSLSTAPKPLSAAAAVAQLGYGFVVPPSANVNDYELDLLFYSIDRFVSAWEHNSSNHAESAASATPLSSSSSSRTAPFPSPSDSAAQLDLFLSPSLPLPQSPTYAKLIGLSAEELQHAIDLATSLTHAVIVTRNALKIMYILAPSSR